MTSHWFWILRRLSRRIWVRATLFSLGGVVTALAATWLSPYIPNDLPTQIGSDAVDNILSIIASSMLTVTTFSLSTMVAAYSAATSNVTPRATRLVIEDTTTHNVLSTFIGSFLFSLVGIIALSTGLYGDKGRVVLFAVTLLVIAAIVVTLLRWIDHLSSLGRVTQTTERVEEAAMEAMRERRRAPYMGGAPLCDPAAIPPTARPVFADAIGYVQHIDVGALSEIARKRSARVYLMSIPGDLVDPTGPIAMTDGFDEEGNVTVRECFTIGGVRSFDQDPRFGAAVLTEIASRALSPATNDLGTAIDVIGRTVRLLSVWGEKLETEEEIRYPNVFVPPILIEDLFDDLFVPIARDGASTVEVGVRLQKAFRTLARFGHEGFAENAKRHSAEALERANAALVVEADKRRIEALAREVGAA
ncbi:DUF2254 domain-containing protein [Aureimonas ureilytica]|uniref:DUF2254 domain-containing protein n=1 Tax=Aureimonas ureilytica TaxID=401562 RepID=UPI000366CBCF|nr:DUF2254 domain-containing protein [Aureimonas ureilytica]